MFCGECRLCFVLKVTLAFLCPQLVVFMDRGFSVHLFINIILSMFLWIPGVIHALMVTLKPNSKTPN